MNLCLFDIDGVIVPESKLFFMHRLSQAYRIPLQKMRPFFDGEFIACLEGRADIEQELGKYLSAWGWSASVHELLAYWLSTERKIDVRVLAHIDALRSRGIRCYIVSNQFAQRAKYLLEEVGLAAHFDGAFFSCDVGRLKDNPEFFKIVLDQLPHDGSKHIVFWDNVPAYVETARHLDIDSRLYTTFERFEDSMRQLMPEPKEMIARGLLGTLFPADTVLALNSIQKGNVAHVYEARLRGIGELIVELYGDQARTRLGSLEARTLARLRRASVPVPELLHIGSGHGTGAYMIFRKIAGTAADETRDKLAVWAQVGAAARTIHAVKNTRYGRLWFWGSRPRLWPSWQAYITDDLDRMRHDSIAYGLAAEDRRLAALALRQCERLKTWNFEPSVIHGDLSLKNVLIGPQGAVSGILDWDELLSARAPHQELSSTFLWTTPEESAAFLRGYGITKAQWLSMKPEVELLQLHKLADYFLFFNSPQAKDPSRAAEMRAKIIDLMHRL